MVSEQHTTWSVYNTQHGKCSTHNMVNVQHTTWSVYNTQHGQCTPHNMVSVQHTTWSVYNTQQIQMIFLVKQTYIFVYYIYVHGLRAYHLRLTNAQNGSAVFYEI